ncbi:hypothetical protein JS44_12210 [Anoxybacillus flavithermus]|uniref:Uncharacterized protein n=1 Tax=Anoxybacillus flavithermus TaxID=33934 RepID=A0A094J2N3_9BACL|nr:hypothetical protein JS44_12210 [Anoxybacillus flavithermus]
MKHTDVFLAQLVSASVLSFSPCRHVKNAKTKQGNEFAINRSVQQFVFNCIRLQNYVKGKD